MLRVIIESPYAGEVERNIAYARAAIRDSLLRGEAPIASHLLYTQEGILNDLIPEERDHGLHAGLAWSAQADKIAFYLDHGWSQGMRYALNWHRSFHHNIDYRFLYEKGLNHANTFRAVDSEVNDSLGVRNIPRYSS